MVLIVVVSVRIITANGSLLAVRSGPYSGVSLDKDISFHRITTADWLGSAAMAASICQRLFSLFPKIFSQWKYQSKVQMYICL